MTIAAQGKKVFYLHQPEKLAGIFSKMLNK
jgi:hypothetical protein